MANSLGLTEVTMAEVVDSTSLVNRYLSQGSGLHKPFAARITDHADDNGGVGGDYDNMAIFSVRHYGHPWVKDAAKQHIISHADAAKTEATVIFPDFDYSTF